MTTKKKQLQDKSGSGVAEGLKNRVRGAIASLKTVPSGKDPEQKWVADQRAAGALNKALSDARKRLPAGPLRRFEVWVDEFTKAQLQAERIGTTTALLGILPKKPAALPLLHSLLSAREELLRAKRMLNLYCTRAAVVRDLLLGEQWCEADRALNEVTAEFGYSYWAIESKIALQHYLGNAAGAKDSVRKFSAGSLGLNKFYFYHVVVK
ncbi:hypothetical protein [Polaromonas sp.]|uniref:hypothetical protein n=1 Tax=Polaromonas sp. TaxID=1869339 RepID=UPI00356269BD